MDPRANDHSKRTLIIALATFITLVIQLVLFSYYYGQLVYQARENTMRIQRIELDIYTVKRAMQ